MGYKAASLAVVLMVVSTAASAQGWYRAGPPARAIADISPQEAAHAVRSAGFRAVAPPVLRGRYYVVPSVDRYGRMNRVLVDSVYGDVVRARPMMVLRHPRPPGAIPMRPWARPAMPLDDDDAAIAPPPRGVPGAVAAMPPAGRGANGTTGAIGDPDDLPPPPSRIPSRNAKSANASTHPTPPRVIPGVKAKKDAKTAAVPPAAAPKNNADAPASNPPNAPPRVVLPGGPPVKEEPKAVTSSGPKLAGETPPAPAPAKVDATPAAPAAKGIPPMPPMQGLE